MTMGSLRNTFLQPDREGNWIDGVNFLYEGTRGFEGHVEFDEIEWREELRARNRERR